MFRRTAPQDNGLKEKNEVEYETRVLRTDPLNRKFATQAHKDKSRGGMGGQHADARSNGSRAHCSTRSTFDARRKRRRARETSAQCFQCNAPIQNQAVSCHRDLSREFPRPEIRSIHSSRPFWMWKVHLA